MMNINEVARQGGYVGPYARSAPTSRSGETIPVDRVLSEEGTRSGSANGEGGNNSRELRSDQQVGAAAPDESLIQQRVADGGDQQRAERAANERYRAAAVQAFDASARSAEAPAPNPQVDLQA